MKTLGQESKIKEQLQFPVTMDFLEETSFFQCSHFPGSQIHRISGRNCTFIEIMINMNCISQHKRYYNITPDTYCTVVFNSLILKTKKKEKEVRHQNIFLKI